MRARRLDRWELAILGLLTAVAFAPLAVLLVRAVVEDSTWTGADSRNPADQLQYLAWVRDSREHGLASNRFGFLGGGHVFLHPMFFLSGLLFKLGVDPRLALVLWKPVAVVVVFTGFLAYVRRVEERPWPRRVALLLGLFAFTPAAAVVRPLDIGGAKGTGDIGHLGAELFAAGRLWGYLPASIAIGLMPLFLLGVERVLDPSRRAPGRGRGWYVAWTAAAGLAATWLHPWQGEILLAIVAGLVAWGGLDRRFLALAPVAAATALPLAYYFLLGESEPAWELARERSGDISGYVPAVVVLGLAPLAAFALVGAASPARDDQERMLRLWPLAAVLVYLVSPSSAYHAFNGLALPLAVLSVRGWLRVGLGRTLAIAACAVFLLPAAIHGARVLRDEPADPPHLLEAGEGDALAALEDSDRPGGVLAAYRLGATVPGLTDRSSWLGHPSWTPDWEARNTTMIRLFNGQLTQSEVRSLVADTGAAYVLGDCYTGNDINEELGSLVTSSRRLGCATLYELARSPKE
jgi:hypothetical protein